MLLISAINKTLIQSKRNETAKLFKWRKFSSLQNDVKLLMEDEMLQCNGMY